MNMNVVPACALATLVMCGGCTNLFSHKNDPLNVEAKVDSTRTRATFSVDGSRGNENVLFFLALSGGGSRASHMSALTMLRLQEIFDDIDLLEEVDVISSVSGGSLPAAYYAISRDQTLNAKGTLSALRSAPPKVAGGKLSVDAKGRIRCTAELTRLQKQELYQALGPVSAKLEQLCERPIIDRWRRWDAPVVKELMTRNYIWRWIVRWFYPENFLKYWFTAFDRADIMAQTMEDGLFDSPTLGGRSFFFSELNTQRPFLILNATSATGQEVKHPLPDEFAFGSVFTFTDEDFRDRLNSSLASYPISYAVMASSAFPLVFANVTLGDYRAHARDDCKSTGADRPEHCREYYLHVFDGGNSDNLGLKSVKRALFELEVAGRLTYDKIIVMQVDAFTKPLGARRTKADPRSLVSLFLDTNFVDAVDALLQHNRASLVGEFQSGHLSWNKGDCEPETQNLPPRLCRDLDKLAGARRLSPGSLNLSDRLFFYHFGFDDVEAEKPDLKAQLDLIPTSFSISADNAKLIEEAVNTVITDRNPCLQQIRAIARGEPLEVGDARTACKPHDKLPQSKQ